MGQLRAQPDFRESEYAMGQLTAVANAVPMVTAHTGRRFYQPELDGLRFYAFLGVFVCHSLPYEPAFYARFHLPVPWLWGAIAKSGAAGVDLFFALSAFLITSILLRERQETGGISLRRFYLRRVLRIWPLYFLLIAVAASTFPGITLPATCFSSATGSMLSLDGRSPSVLRCGRSRSRSSSISYGRY
jgi:peptidoglycan/LPS O-acetylase OafA/YrhL